MIVVRIFVFFLIDLKMLILWLYQIVGLRWLIHRMAGWPEPWLTGPAMMRRYFEDLGPTYIKLGQLVASSPGLFPQRYAEEFKKCLDRVPPFSSAKALAIVRRELGRAPDEVFLSFDERPLAAASIAQVHAARLHDGTDVVVKIQRPRIKYRVVADMAMMRFGARVIQTLVKRVELANPVAIVDDFSRTIIEEIDFRLEGANMDQFNAFFKKAGETELAAPKVYWEYTTEHVLTMERFHGFKADDVDAIQKLGIDSEHYLRRGLRGWLMIMLCTGFFHGDVHAGNLMFLPDRKKIGFLDFGIIGRFSAEQRDQVMRYILTFAAQEFRQTAELLVEIGSAPKTIDLDAFAQHLDETYSPLIGLSLGELKYEEILPCIVRGAIKFGVQLPREFILVLKQLLYFDRYAKLTAPNLNVWQDFSLVDFLFHPIATESGLDVPKIMAVLLKLQQTTVARQAERGGQAAG